MDWWEMHHLAIVRPLLNGPPSRNERDSHTLSAQQAGQSRSECDDDTDHEGIVADVALAKRGVAGEVAAWEQLHGQCHDALLATIQNMLGLQGADGGLTDEIAARVWYTLVANDGELLQRYKPKYGARLITFIGSIAKDEVSRHLRSERRWRFTTRIRKKLMGFFGL